MAHEDETAQFWLHYDQQDLAQIVAVLHKERRAVASKAAEQEVALVRRVISDMFLKGSGIEVGAGPRPFPLPNGTQCLYGDNRNASELDSYFAGATGIPDCLHLDAQTLSGVADCSVDFVISAHVIEHLQNPILSIRSSLRALKPNGMFILVVPDRRFTFDRLRPPTTLEHMIRDEADGGKSTLYQAYYEHVKYIHPLSETPIDEDEIPIHVRKLIEARFDTHFHCWTGDEFRDLLAHVLTTENAELISHIFVQNENIYVIQKES